MTSPDNESIVRKIITELYSAIETETSTNLSRENCDPCFDTAEEAIVKILKSKDKLTEEKDAEIVAAKELMREQVKRLIELEAKNEAGLNALIERDKENKALKAENDVLREQNTMMNDSLVPLEKENDALRAELAKRDRVIKQMQIGIDHAIYSWRICCTHAIGERCPTLSPEAGKEEK